MNARHRGRTARWLIAPLAAASLLTSSCSAIQLRAEADVYVKQPGSDDVRKLKYEATERSGR